MAYDDHYISLCWYCRDENVRDDWERIGGTIGERHYVCHRKRCRAKRERSMRALREAAAARRAAKAKGGSNG